MMKKLATTLTLVFTLLILNAVTRAQTQHGKPSPPTPAPKPVSLSVGEIGRSGSFYDGLYKNRSLGFSITIPKGWNVVSDELNKAGLDTAKEKVAANKSKEFGEAMDTSIANTRILFQAYSYDPANGQTSVLGCGVESTPPGLTLAAYTEFNKNLVLSTNKNSKLLKDTYKKTISGTVFDVFEVEIPGGVATRSQTYFVTSRRNVMFFFVLTYTDGANRTLMENSLGTLTLDK
jgi:hypothetical protein